MTDSNHSIAQGRVPALDGLRGLAVLMVVAAHVNGRWFSQFGGAGVTVFFLLSGFLITTLLLSEHDRSGKVDVFAFYGRRARRLLPGLATAVVLTPLLYWVVGDPRLANIGPGMLRAVLYVEDFFKVAGSPSVFMHTWSLAVEEQFYIFWPLMLIALLRRTSGEPRRMSRAIAVAAMAAGMWHLVVSGWFGEMWTYYSPDSNAVFLLAGCALAARMRVQQIPRPSPFIAWLAILLIGPLLFVAVILPASNWQLRSLVLIPVVIGGTVLLIGAHTVWLLRWRALQWVGTVSYGVYLWHWILLGMQPGGQAIGGPARLLLAAASIPVAAASWYLVERPVLRWRPRQPSPAGAWPAPTADRLPLPKG
jgi:peptidoglycan/LPS O-acetylase OafA/YrhL